jgi:hypothetical protein
MAGRMSPEPRVLVTFLFKDQNTSASLHPYGYTTKNFRPIDVAGASIASVGFASSQVFRKRS